MFIQIKGKHFYYVLTSRNINQSGFTLIHLLLSILLLIMILLMLPFLIQTTSKLIQYQIHPFEYEWRIFEKQLSAECLNATSINIFEEKLVMQLNNNSTIIIEKYGGSIRRRVNYKGHEIYLQNVNTVQFKREESGISLLVQDKYGGEHLTLFKAYGSISSNNE